MLNKSTKSKIQVVTLLLVLVTIMIMCGRTFAQLSTVKPNVIAMLNNGGK